MKKLSVILTICLLAMNIIAQQKNYLLKGQVLKSIGSPIEQAKIFNVQDSSEFTFSDKDGLFTLETSKPISIIAFEKQGYIKQKVNAGGSTFMQVTLQPIISTKKDKVVLYDALEEVNSAPSPSHERMQGIPTGAGNRIPYQNNIQYNTESYSPINENGYHTVKDEPLSTFSIDVDRASYSNVRRFLNNGQIPPIDAVRVEEMVNYFDYDYDAPEGKDPVKFYTGLTKAPWNQEHLILHVGVKAKDINTGQLPPSNLVFLIDVSGSMNAANKLPLLKSAMHLLVDELRDEDKVSIVVYAGAAGLVLEPTPGHRKAEIKRAIEQLNAGGSTAGGAGIKLAYKVATQELIEGGNNRVILATDGDFNVGASSDGEMQRLIELERQKGVFLTVLGFGMGNYKDSKMEVLADKGNGNYAYIDNLTEARKTLVNEFGSTLFTVAKDVKLQVEFNPQHVGSYRLIGYENRLLNKEDFNDDTKDAGEMGAGHVVTALYEIIPAGKNESSKVDPLKYTNIQSPAQPLKAFDAELATIKLRYKQPDENESKRIQTIVRNNVVEWNDADVNIRWAASVAGFGMLLRNSNNKGSLTYDQLLEVAAEALGADKEGYRRECLQLMRNAQKLTISTASR